MLEIVKIVQRTENVMSKENAFVMKIGKVQIVVFRNDKYNCSEQGKCIDVDKCACDQGFTGPFCEERIYLLFNNCLSASLSVSAFTTSVAISTHLNTHDIKICELDKKISFNFYSIILICVIIAVFFVFIVSVFILKRKFYTMKYANFDAYEVYNRAAKNQQNNYQNYDDLTKY